MSIVVSTYPMVAPTWSVNETGRFYAEVLRRPEVEAVELPSAGVEALQECTEWWDALSDGGAMEITELPRAMAALRIGPAYGLASVHPEGRGQAVEDGEAVRRLVHEVNQRLGRPLVRTVTLVSAPRRFTGSEGSPWALAESLRTLAARDWSGAALRVEHCDAWTPEHRAHKGFLGIQAELDAVAEVQGSRTAVGMTINWARSAIEHRSAEAVIEHIRVAREHGLLRTLALSGCSDVAGPWGEAWDDSHLPFSGCFPPGSSEQRSLLTDEALTDAVLAAGPEATTAIKISVRPTTAPAEERMAFLDLAIVAVLRARTAMSLAEQ